ncbi:MAG TPA: helix-turn-helix transcriptional regulator [Ktedonobacterales bacterium]
MDTRSSSRGNPPRAVDLRRVRAPRIEIVACATYDFLLSIHVALHALTTEPHEFDISDDWVRAAVAKCAARDPRAIETLGRYVGDGRPSSLQAGFISLIERCPGPKTVPVFIDWLATIPAFEFAEELLDQDGFSSDWTTLLRQALAEPATMTNAPGPATLRLLEEMPGEAQPAAKRVLMEVEVVRAEVIDALRAWYETVFAAEEARIMPLLQREAAEMEQRRAASSLEDFIEREMHGVRWQQPLGVRRYIFAPSVFCPPAVFMRFWRGALTFCTPVRQESQADERPAADPHAPDEEMVRFFTALADVTRLRILRLLLDREMYLTELADRLALRKATIKHHMVRLRAAGLVFLYVRKPMTFYALRPDTPERARRWLADYLRDPRHSDAESGQADS